MLVGSVLGVVVVAALVVAWRMDHRGTGRKGKYVGRPTDDAAVGEAKARMYFRDMGQTGPNGQL